MNGAPQSQATVTVRLQDLESGSVEFSTLEAAFGPTSLGIIVVKDLPPRFVELRAKVLGSASYLAQLDPELLESLAAPQANYLVGWSHGRETLKPGVFDTHKGSYYVNCAFHVDPSLSAAPVSKDIADLPEYTSPNIWPPASHLPGFRQDLEELCNLVIDVAALVARACDRYAEHFINEYENGYLERVVRGSLSTKARLLHYFPPKADVNGEGKEDLLDDDSWCATHLDHGCLTGLTSAMYINESHGLPQFSSLTDTQPAKSLPSLSSMPCPDSLAGLYIRSRTGNTTKVSIPADCLGFQTGEALQLITRGKFRAVPHFVSPGSGKGGMNGVARNTLAVFTQPNLEEIVDSQRKMTFAEFSREVVGRNT